MHLLEERIKKDGRVLSGNVLKVDNFLNHQCDTLLQDKMGEEFRRLFSGKQINKILTIESSGIGIACVAARFFNFCPVVFAKKTKTSNMSDNLYQTNVHSYTHNMENIISVEKGFLTESDNVLIIDDFLANGCAIEGLLELCRQANAKVQGVGVCIEKGFQDGGKKLRAKHVDLKSLAIIKSMDETNGTIVFEHLN